MDATPAKLIQYFDGHKQSIIPIFQRPYTWEKKDWSQLWEDVVGQYDEFDDENLNQDHTHFLGAIVSIPAVTRPVGVTKHLIIDGQQRLTTFALLLVALQQHVEAGQAKLILSYLVNEHHTGPDHLKLLPTQGDRKAFLELVKGLDPIDPSHRLVRAFKFFFDAIGGVDGNGQPINPQRLLHTLTSRLQVVTINLDQKDDPYLIFESLNFKGTPLTPADLVRNHVLMRFKHSLGDDGEQNEVYRDIWRPMEERLGEKLTEFSRANS